MEAWILSPAAIVALIVYSIVGLLVWSYLYATWDGYKLGDEDTAERVGCFMVMLPEAGIVLAGIILLLWPVFLVARVFRYIFRGGQA